VDAAGHFRGSSSIWQQDLRWRMASDLCHSVWNGQNRHQDIVNFQVRQSKDIQIGSYGRTETHGMYPDLDSTYLRGQNGFRTAQSSAVILQLVSKRRNTWRRGI
jgi:hypothetical protein